MQHSIVSKQKWLAARKALLAKEKELTKARDALSAARRDLPWVKLEKAYAFDTPQGRKSLTDLFGDKSQLVVYHFMLGPGWVQGCPSCSYLADHFDCMTVHLAQRDVTFMAVSRAPLAEIEAYKKRMGWHFPWASSYESDFNSDFGVTFSKDDAAAKTPAYNYGTVPVNSEELPGLSTFCKSERGEVFHTYSTYARGLDILVGTYNVLDMAPKGRDEDSLPWTMAWVRRHDEYERSAGASCCGGKA